METKWRLEDKFAVQQTKWRLEDEISACNFVTPRNPAHTPKSRGNVKPRRDRSIEKGGPRADVWQSDCTTKGRSGKPPQC